MDSPLVLCLRFSVGGTGPLWNSLMQGNSGCGGFLGLCRSGFIAQSHAGLETEMSVCDIVPGLADSLHNNGLGF